MSYTPRPINVTNPPEWAVTQGAVLLGRGLVPVLIRPEGPALEAPARSSRAVWSSTPGLRAPFSVHPLATLTAGKIPGLDGLEFDRSAQPLIYGAKRGLEIAVTGGAWKPMMADIAAERARYAPDHLLLESYGGANTYNSSQACVTLTCVYCHQHVSVNYDRDGFRRSRTNATLRVRRECEPIGLTPTEVLPVSAPVLDTTPVDEDATAADLLKTLIGG